MFEQKWALWGALAILALPGAHLLAITTTTDHNNIAQIGLTPNFTPGVPYSDLQQGPGVQFVGGATTGGFNTSLNGTARADYGVLKNFASAYGSAVAVTRSTWTDMVTITSPSIPNGTPGTLTFSIYINGLLQADLGSSYAAYSVTGDMAGGFSDLSRTGHLNSPALGGNFTGDQLGLTYTSSPVSFVYGTPMPMSVQLEVSAVVGYDGNQNPGSATGNFLNTLLWNGIANVTANGNAVPTFSATSSSGTNWANAIADLPEPASLALLAFGSLSLMARRCRR